MAEQHEKALVPQIRFTGFTDPWEQRKLGELYKEVSEKNDLTYGRDRIISVAHMYFNPVVYVTEDDYLKTYNVMRLGDIAFEGNRSKNFAHGRLVENTIGDGIVSHVFKVFRPIQPFDLMYWKYSINNEKAMKDVLTRSTKASTMMHELVAKDFLNEEIAVPSLEEQRQIGAFFDRLDSLITLHQRKYDKLCVLKKSMLDKMFPKGGSLYPEIRFAGFTDPWEQRKLGEVASGFEYGLNAAASDFDGEKKYLRITDIDDQTREFRTDDLSSPDINNPIDDRYLLKEGDILFARTGASVGKTYLYKASDGKTYYAGFLIRAHVSDEADAGFIFQSTLTERYKQFVLLTSQRSGQPGINAQEYSDLLLPLPSLMEQRQIGAFFDRLDSLITLHQRKLELLRNIKKSMLDKMFV